MDENQIDRLEQSVQRLEKIVGEQQAEIENLKQMLWAAPFAAQQQMPQPMPLQAQQQVMQPLVQRPVMQQPMQYPAQQPSVQQQQVMQPQVQQPMPIQPQSPAQPQVHPTTPPPINPADYGLGAVGNAKRGHKYDNMENKIGTSMGIVASILVFVGIVLFVTLVYSSLTDIVKVMCIFAFSFVILAAGTFMMRRKVNAFTMSVTGCGMGAVFLSLFVTHIYFGMINRFVLYLLIAIWAGLVYFFFSKKSYAFKLIGQIGITVSVLFGCFSLHYSVPMPAALVHNWWRQYIFLLVFFVIISVLYLLVKSENTVAKAAPLVILDYISILALAVVGIDNSDSPAIWVFVSVIYMFFLLYAYVFMAERNNSVPALGIIYIIMSIYTCGISFDALSVLDLESGGAAMFILHILVLLAAFAAEMIRGHKKSDNDAIHIIMTVILYVFLLNRTAYFDALYDIMGFGIYILPMLGCAYYFKDKTALWLSYATMFLFIACNGKYLTINIIVAALAIAVSGGFLYYDKKMYSSNFKCVWYLISLLILVTYFFRTADRLDMRAFINFAWSYILIAGINTISIHIGLAKDWSRNTNEKEKNVLCIAGILNIILMLIGLTLLDNHYDWPLRMIMLVVVAGVFANNIKTIYERHKDNPVAGIYTGVKLSIFIFAALNAYSFSGPYVSIGWLVLAIALILSGFKWQYKYLRMYGLFLSMFSIVKLLVFDISYDNPVIRAGSFLVSGGLCFVISLLYNAYSKKD